MEKQEKEAAVKASMATLWKAQAEFLKAVMYTVLFVMDSVGVSKKEARVIVEEAIDLNVEDYVEFKKRKQRSKEFASVWERSKKKVSLMDDEEVRSDMLDFIMRTLK